MSLRTRILLFLFSFAIFPLLLAVLINLPLILDRVDLFYRQAFLHNLRADFSDLDQHLASRDGSLRLLAKLPEPRAFFGDREGAVQASVMLARNRYTQWINNIIGEQHDITQIVFFNRVGKERYRLHRDLNSLRFMSMPTQQKAVVNKRVMGLLSGDIKDVISTPLSILSGDKDTMRAMTMQLLAPISDAGGARVGVIAITLDVGGLVRRDNETLWVHDTGDYLQLPGLREYKRSAFDDFPGLEELFKSRMVKLWEGETQRAIWVPMFLTDSGAPLWVGREVHDEPLVELREEIILRVMAIIAALVAVFVFVANAAAKRIERISRELTGGIQKTLETDDAVEFFWNDTPELRQLANDLTTLTKTHASQVQNLRSHAHELEQTSRYKSEFLANVSHELRTPLNSILLLSKLLDADAANLNDDARQKAGVIHKASGDLKALIDNILDLSRVEAGQMALDIELVELLTLVTDLKVLLKPQFDDKNLALQIDIAPDAAKSIVTDLDKVRQILKNFLANAVKFTDQGTVILSVKAAQPPYSVELSVIDSGIGIASDKQQLIFEAFKQADGSTSRRYGGTGLGLTISRQLAHLLGGDIRLHSKVGKGATFSLLLPEVTQLASDKEPSLVSPVMLPNQDEDSPEDMFSCPNCHLLLLDDDIKNQLKISEYCKSWGVTISLAGDLDESLETIDELEKLDVIVVNMGMSGIDHCATIAALKQHAENAILLGIQAENAQSLAIDDVDHILPQPLCASDLAQVLKTTVLS